MKYLLRFCVLILCFYVTNVDDVYASDREMALKAGLIFNFAVYSKGEWFDATKHDNYLICSPNADFVKIARQTLKNKTIRKSLVVIQKISLNNLHNQHCNSIFFSADTAIGSEYSLIEQNFLGSMLVGESEGFIERGGHINFFLAGGKVRFELDPIGLHNSNIDISSKVIRLGKVVNRGTND